MAANVDNQLGTVLPFKKPDGSDDIYDGTKSKNWTEWRRRHELAGQKIHVAGFSYTSSLTASDRGNINGVAHIGVAASDARVKDEADLALRKASSGTRFAANLAQECAVRRFIEDTPELAGDGYYAMAYAHSQFYLAEPRTDLDDKKRDFMAHTMEGDLGGPDKLNEDSMDKWCAKLQGHWRSDLTAQQRIDLGEQELCIRLIHGASDKLGEAKINLMAEPCLVPNCVWRANHVATVFAAGPPIVYPQTAKVQGEYKMQGVVDYMCSRWRAGIKANQIRVKPVDRVRYVKGRGGHYDGKKKSGWKSKPSNNFDSSSHKRNDDKVSGPKLHLVCYNCGGVGHVATKCGTEKGSLTRSLLMGMTHPSEVTGKWPASWTGGKVRKTTDDEDDAQDSDEGAIDDILDDEVEGEEAESDEDTEETAPTEKVKYLKDKESIRYITEGVSTGSFSGSKVRSRVLRLVRGKK